MNKPTTPQAAPEQPPIDAGQVQQQVASAGTPQAQLQPSLLPTKRTVPTLDAATAKVLLYGAAKIGKTSLAAQLDPEHTLFLATEPGLGAQSVYATELTSWVDFRRVGAELRDGKHDFSTVVVDTVDVLHNMCQAQVMEDLGAAHPSDLGYGKGWRAVSDEFQLRIAALCSLGLGVWFISHAKFEELKTRIGSVTKATPTLQGSARDWLTGFVDFIFYAESVTTEKGEQRILQTTASETVEAGGRVPVPGPLLLDAAAVREAIAAASPAQPQEAAS